MDDTHALTGDRQFASSGSWALATDGVQWILQRRRSARGRPSWRPVSFVRSTRAVLARCMREKGIPPADQVALLDGLPETFTRWAQDRERAGASEDVRVAA